MKLVSISGDRAGILLNDEVLDIAASAAIVPQLAGIPATVLAIVQTEGKAVASLASLLPAITEDAALLDRLRKAHALQPIADVRLDTPLAARLILAAGMNYTDHLEEMDTPRPPSPYFFVKAPSSVAGDGDVIDLPENHDAMVDWEAELAVVIGKPCYNVGVDAALDHVAGYMAANDMSARDWAAAALQPAEPMETVNRWGLNILGKQFPGFCPMGPVMLTADALPDPGGLEISCRVNGETMQRSNTARMVFSPAELISYASQFQRLLPGDVLLTGTMGGVGFGRKPQIFLKRGDVVEIEIDRIGTLRNIVG